MKKMICILLFIPIFLLSALELDMDKVNSVLIGMHASKKLNFYSADLAQSMSAELMLSSLSDADVVLFPKKDDSSKMVIVDSYSKLRVQSNSIGAIYQKKGRTQIVFIDERLKKHGLILSNIFNKYIITECQLNPICLLKPQ